MTVVQNMRAGLLATAAITAAAPPSGALAAVSAPSPTGKAVEPAHMEKGHDPDPKGGKRFRKKRNSR
jgi:hypothetical protein